MRIDEWAKMGLHPQEIIPVINGIKPLLRTGIDNSNIRNLRQACRKSNLVCEIVDVSDDKHYHEFVAYVSLSSSPIEEYIMLDESEDDSDTVYSRKGELLGYPSCCSRSYSRYIAGMRTGQIQRLPLITHSFLRTEAKPSYLLNNILVPHSKHIPKGLEHQWGSIRQYSLVNHIPCSYCCKKSMEYAREVENAIKKESPTYLRDILDYIRRPVLFFRDMDWVVFDGSVEGKSVKYKTVKCSLLQSQQMRSAIAKGCEIIVDEGCINIKDNQGKVKKMDIDGYTNGILMDFS